jgi:hypothetical protein
MPFGSLHPPLAIGMLEETENRIKRLLGIVQDIGKRPPLTAQKELLTGDRNDTHTAPTGFGRCP